MRVVFLTHNYPRRPGDLAGAFLHTLAVGLQRSGHEVRVLAPSDAGQGGEDLLDGVVVRRIRYAAPERERYAYTGRMQAAVRSPAGLMALASLVGRLRRAAREEVAGRADAVIHAHWWIPAGLAAPPEGPTVLTVHGTDGALLRRSAAARWIARPAFLSSRVVTTVSADLARTVSSATGVALERCRVQPMPVDTSGWTWSGGGGGCLVVARLTSQKRIDLVIDALAHLHRAGRRVPCTIVGDGPERPALEARARAAGLPAVRFTGQLPFAETLAQLMAADLAVLPFDREGFGLAAAEALMVGVPVVACEDGGGLLDIVPPGNGGRVVPPEAERLARAITELLGNPDEREAARRLGTEWRARLAPDAVARRFAGWYAEALGG